MPTLFIDPELGRVGLSERAGCGSGLRHRRRHPARRQDPSSQHRRGDQGLLKAVVDRGTGSDSGLLAVLPQRREVMSVVQMAMIGKVPYPQVRDTIFTHPTMAECWLALRHPVTQASGGSITERAPEPVWLSRFGQQRSLAEEDPSFGDREVLVVGGSRPTAGRIDTDLPACF